MSSELIAAWFWTKGTSKIYPDAAKAVIDSLSEQGGLQGYWAHATGDGFDATDAQEVREVKDSLRGEIDQIATLMIAENPEGYNPDGFALTSPGGDTLWWAGGTSWGDDPNETFTALSNVLECPTVLKALRGDGDWADGRMP